VTQELGRIRPQTLDLKRKGPSFGSVFGRADGAAVRRITWAALLGASLLTLVCDVADPHWLLLLPLFGGALFGSAWLGASSQARRDDEQLRGYGQYTLVREIGAGGMGVVYEASHALLRRPTAIKLIRQSDTDPAARAEALLRFEREVLLTSQLSHPNTIVVYDYGCTEDGTFYYAMEYVDGVDLERLVRVEGPLSAGRVIHLVLQVCGSLLEAHQKSLIHRDIKPANLLVCERGGIPDTIKVLDFGLVKRLDGPIVSGVNVLVGTPLYMAPEVKRDPSRASVRSDVYSLGAVMHWLTTGRTLQEAAVARASVPPTALPELPIDLERVIVRCTEQDPSERPESMEQLANELRQCVDCGRWTPEDARHYWEARGKRLSRVLSQPAAPGAKTLAAS
jgi:serine/threonine-protein kinase